MSALFLLIGASLIVAIGFLLAFIWSVKDGQYDDDYTPSIRMLFDANPQTNNQEKSKRTSIKKENKSTQNNQK